MAHPLTEFLNNADYSDLRRLALEVMNFAKVNQIEARIVHYPHSLTEAMKESIQNTGESVEHLYATVIVNRASQGNRDIVSVTVIERISHGDLRAHCFDLITGAPVVTFEEHYGETDRPFVPDSQNQFVIRDSYSRLFVESGKWKQLQHNHEDQMRNHYSFNSRPQFHFNIRGVLEKKFRSEALGLSAGYVHFMPDRVIINGEASGPYSVELFHTGHVDDFGLLITVTGHFSRSKRASEIIDELFAILDRAEDREIADLERMILEHYARMESNEQERKQRVLDEQQRRREREEAREKTVHWYDVNHPDYVKS